jgi:two-component system cell cycle sensor histidine kinase/response regulator CckA
MMGPSAAACLAPESRGRQAYRSGRTLKRACGFRGRAVLLGVTVVTSVTGVWGAEPAEPERVLVLHSYHQGYAWTDAVQRGLEAGFKDADLPVEWSVEYMDTKRYSGERLYAALRALYADKYAGRQPDVIVSCDDDALEFLFAERDALFPGVPVVFCGLDVDRYDPALLAGRKGYTGVVERLDVRSTVNLIIELQPKVKRIVFVHDRTTSGLANRREAEALRLAYAGRVAFVFPDDGEGLSEGELLAEVRGLGPESVVYFLGFFRGRLGAPLTQEAIVPLLSQAAAVPIYTHADVFFGDGVLGGKLLSGEVHGRSTAAKALRLLRGEAVADVPVTVESSNRLMFDARQMRRFGIDEADLPAGSVVAFGEQSFLERHRVAVRWAVAGLVALSAFTVLLLVDRARRLRLQRRLAESEERYRRLVDRSPGVLYVFSDKRGGLYRSQRIEEVLGYTAEELAARPMLWNESIHPEDLPRVWAAVEAAEDGKDLEVEYRIRDRAGKIHWLRDCIISKRREGDETIVEGLALEITARKEAEGALEEQRQLLLEAERMAGMGSWTWDIVHDRWMVSENWRVLHGCADPELSTATLRRFAYPDDTAAIQRAFDRALAGAGPYDIEHRIVRARDGAVRYVQAFGEVAFDAAGKPLRMMGVALDVTERKTLEQRRRELEQQVEMGRRHESLATMAGAVAHNFNNILTAVIGNQALALGQLGAEDGARQCVQDAQEAAEAAAKLSRLMLVYVGHGHAQHRTFCLGELLRGERERLVGAAEAAGVPVAWEVPADDRLLVRGDPQGVCEAVGNLVTNAVEALVDGQGEVRVRLQQRTLNDAALARSYVVDKPAAGVFACVRVEDTGRGLEDEELQRLFEPFYTKKFVGRGLGLATLLGVMRSHEGAVFVESEVGRGTAVELGFPLVGEFGGNGE